MKIQQAVFTKGWHNANVSLLSVVSEYEDINYASVLPQESWKFIDLYRSPWMTGKEAGPLCLSSG